MPPLPNVSKVIRLEFDFSIFEDLVARCRNFWSYTGTAPSATDLSNFCSAIFTSVGTNLAPLSGNHVTYTAVRGFDLTSPTAATGEATGNHVGTRGTTLLTADVCALESLIISRRYRGGHPRVYWPFGITTDLFDQQTWSAAAVSAFDTGLAALKTSIAGAGWSGAGTIAQESVSYYNGFTVHTGVTGRARNVSTPRGSAVVDPVIQGTIRTGIAVQRKRLLHLA